jgi:hypothetical protein
MIVMFVVVVVHQQTLIIQGEPSLAVAKHFAGLRIFQKNKTSVFTFAFKGTECGTIRSEI